MYKQLLNFFSVVIVSALLVVPLASDARNLDEIIASGNVKIGVHPNIPPLSYRDTNGEW